MLRGKLNLVGLAGGNANAIRHGFNGAKRPAGATVSLVTDSGNGGALWPSSARVKGIGNVLGLGGSDDFGQLGVGKYTQPAANSGHLDSKKTAVKASSPSSVGSIHLIDDSLIECRRVVEQGCGQGGGRESGDKKYLRFHFFSF
jgi:hypothetical protein